MNSKSRRLIFSHWNSSFPWNVLTHSSYDLWHNYYDIWKVWLNKRHRRYFIHPNLLCHLQSFTLNPSLENTHSTLFNTVLILRFRFSLQSDKRILLYGLYWLNRGNGKKSSGAYGRRSLHFWSNELDSIMWWCIIVIQ